MKKKTVYVTAGGLMHDTYGTACGHANVVYTRCLFNAAAKLVQINKYAETRDYLHGRLDEFLEIARLKAGIEV